MSVRLSSRQKSPVNGFRFQQRETGWKSWESNPNTLWDFEALCIAVRNHRLANLRFKLETDLGRIRDEVDRVNAERMSRIPGAESYIIQTGEVGQTAGIKKAIPQRLLNVAVAVRNLNAGRGLLAEWKEQGYNTVEKTIANNRAEICTRCPKNGTGGLERYFTIPASEKIRSEIEEIKHEGLTTDYDEKLGVCEACLCNLKVKVWTPMPLIEKHLLPESKSKLWSNCWIQH